MIKIIFFSSYSDTEGNLSSDCNGGKLGWSERCAAIGFCLQFALVHSFILWAEKLMVAKTSLGILKSICTNKDVDENIVNQLDAMEITMRNLQNLHQLEQFM